MSSFTRACKPEKGAAMTQDYRMFVELPNGAKFRAQGQTNDVREDALTFYSKLLDVPKPTSAPVETSATTSTDTNGNGNGHGETPDVADVVASEMPDAGLPLDRLFAKDRNGTVSLRALPHGE